VVQLIVRMNARTRMFKTLIALAAAMTVCAAFLSWIEPPDPSQNVLTDPGFATEQVERALAQGAGVDSFEWARIAIVPSDPVVGKNAPALAAKASPTCDFVVLENGIVAPANRPSGQSRSTSRSSTVVVGLAGVRQQADLPMAQWIGLRALVSALLERRPSSATTVRVDVETDAHAWPAESADTVTRLLAREGLSGIRL
jgi:hypothetical protein